MKKKKRRTPKVPAVRSKTAKELDLRSASPISYPLEFRMRAVREVVDHGANYGDVARLLGIGRTSVKNWVERYEAEGDSGLDRRPAGAKPRPKPERQEVRKAVTELREEHPEYGTRRIREMLRRFEGLGVSEHEARQILHEAGLIPLTQPKVEKPPNPPTRFERAEPNQLWQSDIFTFLLRRHERVYLTGFLDDHSRFMVSHVVAHHQKSSLVMEALARAIAAYGAPREILTDQGRQYVAWRGETEFAHELRRQNIQHIKSRPHHPQTLGKIERFWKTLWDEFLSRTVFADFADCVRRLDLFVQSYNFHRPHQALEGLVPADRYFRAAPQVRATIEKSVEENARRMALQQPTQKPFYLAGQLGNKSLSISAARDGLRVQVGDDKPQTISMSTEDDDASQETPTRLSGAPAEAEDAGETDSEMVDEFEGLERNRTAPMPADFERAQRREAGESGGRGSRNNSSSLLSTRGKSVGRDDGGFDTWDRWEGSRQRDDERQDGGAGGEGSAPRTRKAAGRKAPIADAEDYETWPAQSGSTTAEEEELEPFLDNDRQEAFEKLESEGIDQSPDWRPRDRTFDPDEGWRGRAVTWDRKLIGQDASLEELSEEDIYDEGAEAEIYDRDADTGRAGGAILSRPLRTHPADDDDRGGEYFGPRTSVPPQRSESSPRGDRGGVDAEAARPSRSPSAREGTIGRNREPEERESRAAGEERSRGPTPGRSESSGAQQSPAETRDQEEIDGESGETIGRPGDQDDC